MADDEVDPDYENLKFYQSMIDISAERLEGLRTKCATSAELTRQEIRTLEGKLIKLFSRQLVLKARLGMDDLKNIPSLPQWLQVVGLSKESIQGVCQKVTSLDELKQKSEHELRTILNEKNASPEELGRLHRALHNLCRYTEVLMRDDKTPSDNVDIPLYWDSWDRHHHLKNNLSPRVGRSRATRASVPSEDCLPFSQLVAATNNNAHLHGQYQHEQYQHQQRGGQQHITGHIGGIGGSVATLVPSCSVSSINSLISDNKCTQTPPLTPPVLTKGKGNDLRRLAGEKVKFPTTPPPRKKHLTGKQTSILLPDVYPLTKSKSHESQLAANKVDNGDSNTGNEQTGTTGRRGRLPTEPGPGIEHGYNSPLVSSPIKSPPYNSGATGADSDDSSYKSTSLQVPKSPRTPTVSRQMGHVIAHRFTKTFKVMTVCNFCNRQMFGTGLKCKECKYKCHRECENKVPPSCGLPQEFVEEFKKSIQSDVFQPNQSPNLLRTSSPNQNNLLSSLRHNKRQQYNQPAINIPPFPGPDSSSNTSSCNSSTPSSPALLNTHTPHALTKPQQFHFPDVVGHSHRNINHQIQVEIGVTIETHSLKHASGLEETVETVSSHDSERTVSVSGSVSTDSDRTPVRVDSQDSQVSDSETITERDGHRWPRQNSLSMREWDIPFDELKIGEPIGTGRFGTVYRGNWHGDVAIKLLNMDYLDDEKTLETFKMEVGIFRKTRHENLMLFMGACMKPPRLAIVTSLSKGNTLYTHIHLRKDKFNVNKTTLIAQQISQGLGYLHAKGIVHKDLKSKNIFLESGKVVIADFGLFNVTKLCFGNRKGDSLGIPPGWLCYLAPELVRSLKAHQSYDEELPFTKDSDVYAFGTVWYELLCGEWPFKGQPPESIIWQVGKGMKQPLANLQASRDVKDILMQCWSFKPKDRPEFLSLLKTLTKLPKKRLARSPSHPIHLSRSAESVF